MASRHKTGGTVPTKRRNLGTHRKVLGTANPQNPQGQMGVPEETGRLPPRARWVVKEFEQVKGLDYQQVLAAVVRADTFVKEVVHRLDELCMDCAIAL